MAELDTAFFSTRGTKYSLGITPQDIVGGATAYYNCHTYAWHLTEGNSDIVWINNKSPFNFLDPYWSGSTGCFVVTFGRKELRHNRSRIPDGMRKFGIPLGMLYR